MKKSTNLNSKEWCDIIFKNKNQSYGAYQLRISSSKRHLIALGCVLFLTVAATLLPTLISKASEMRKSKTEAIDEVRILDRIDDGIADKIVEIVIPEPPTIDKSKILNTVTFKPPVIDIDENIADDVVIHTTESIINDDRAIGSIDFSEGTDDKAAEALKDEDIIADRAQDETPREFVEVMPQFPGGEAEMMKYISKNLVYPSADVENGRQGRVTLKFVVTSNGTIEQVKVLKGISPSCDREAMRVISGMPKWIPGKQNGVPVAVYFNIPVLFRLM